MSITTKDLAKICGVSRTTVHRALTDTGRINPQTKELILNTAKKYDYRPDLLARGLAKGQTYYIGVVVMDVNNRYFAQMLSAIEVEARKRGYFINITLHEKNKDMEKEQLERLADYHVDGIILSSIHQGEEYKQFLENLHTPIVTIDNRVAKGIPFVGIREKEAARTACMQIARKGYQKIVFVCPPLADRKKENIYVHTERAKGVKEIAKEFPSLEIEIIGEKDYFEKCREELISTDKRTAFFCSGDMFALELIRYLKEQGLQAPEDYGIMGFDNIDILRFVSPKLSTIDNAVKDVAMAAVNLLFDLINGEEREMEKKVDFLIVEGDTI